jgi:DNA replication initiation complex subunit (GINS family)
LSKHVKLSVYRLSWDKVKKVRDAFYEICEKYIKELNLPYEVPSASSGGRET